MEDAVPVHVVDGLQELVHVVLDPVLRQVVPLALDCVVHVHVHEFEDQGESTSWLVTVNGNRSQYGQKATLPIKKSGGSLGWWWHLLENFVELDDLGVGTEPAEGLDLSEVVDLLDVVEVVLHALDGHILPRLYALGLQNLREGSFAFL